MRARIVWCADEKMRLRISSPRIWCGLNNCLKSMPAFFYSVLSGCGKTGVIMALLTARGKCSSRQPEKRLNRCLPNGDLDYIPRQ